jgi:hypothetical protein
MLPNLLRTDSEAVDPRVHCHCPEMPSTLRLKKRQRTYKAPEESDVRRRMPVGARDVFNAIDLPIEEDMANVRTFTMASHTFDVGTVLWAHVQDRSPSLDLERARPPAAHARHWSINQLPRFEEKMTDGFAVYSDVATRHVKVLEIQKEHTIFRCPLQAHTRGKLRPYWRRAHPIASPSWAGTRLGHGTGIWTKAAAAAHSLIRLGAAETR